MDGLDPELEDCFLHEVYIEFRFEEWTLLSTLNAVSQQRLCAEISNALAAAECKVLAIRARSYALHLLLKLDAAVSINDVLNFVTGSGRALANDPSVEEGPLFYAVETVSPSETIDAVVRIHAD